MAAGSAARGIVAAGHEATADAAVEILRAGGNAFDAVVAALAAACVVEPVLASLGGGGFALAVDGRGNAKLFDFFAQTPGRVRPTDELDFQPVMADFGTVQQEFHTGFGAAATPGMVAGLFRLQRDLGRLPMRELVAPATALAREGVPVAPNQAFIKRAVAPILLFSDSAKTTFESLQKPGETLQESELLRLPALADCLESLAIEGERLFYEGEIATMIERMAVERGGSVTREDLAAYSVVLRSPLRRRFAEYEILGNPAPSSGGPLITFALALAEDVLAGDTAPNPLWFATLANIMARTNDARRSTGLDLGCDNDRVTALLAEPHLAAHRRAIAGRALKTGGTTHVSVIDADGNAVAATVSNGEGCGHVLPDAGFMLNNMLGEEDINPQGFFNWQPNTRISSMMAPTVVNRGREWRLALGSGGSNRIRTAILQVLCNILGFGQSVNDAIEAPRLHYERGVLNVEAGFSEDIVNALTVEFDKNEFWPDRNFFFGGVHGTLIDTKRGMTGAGDPRRGGVAKTA